MVSFVARNLAQLGLQTFERVSETDRRRVRDDTVALTLARPNPTMTAHELIYGLVADYKLYDVAIWLVHESTDAVSGWEIHPIPPAWVTSTGGGTAWAPAWVEVLRPNAGRPVRIDAAENLLIFHGWNPGDPVNGSSPVDALRGVLAEQIHANAYRQQVWTRGGRVGAVLVRPAGSPTWSDPARERFSRDWKSKWTGNDGPKAGGTPILEDGMDLKRIGFNAKEDEWVEGAKLALSTVAQVYHVNPTMIGLLDNANFSNVREFRRMLYGETLGPDLAMIEDRLNAFLVPRLSNRPGLYVEFNIAEKLQGSFEEQTTALQSSIGRPWMTANEGRALQNKPALSGDADALVTPLNVLVGGQASPRDSAPKAIGRATGEPLRIK
ncbi:MAG TPA: phage portal protein, partial [Coriobacteriia bacterium]|nr:phage portal protein [Coriobacteriia bacterium]